MAVFEEIYGVKIKIPEPEENDLILNFDKPKDEQLWVWEDLPSIFDKVTYNKNGDLVLTPEQEEYADVEVSRCKKGVHIYING